MAVGWAKALSGDQKQFNLFIDKMLDGFAYHKIVVDKLGKPVDYIFVEVNHAFERMTGLKREQIIGKKVTDVLVGIENDPADWIGIYGKVALAGEPFQFENHAEPLDKWFRVSAYCPEKGYFVALFEDITDRKKTEEALKRNEEKYRQIVETAEEGIWTAKPDGTTTYVNKKMAEMLGYTPEELVGKVGIDFLAKGQELIVKQTRKELDTKERVQREIEFLRKDGTILWTIANTAPLFDEYGKHVANIAMHTDISMRKEAEEATKRQAELIDLSPDAIIVRKLDGTITFWSKGAEKLYGWSKDEAIGQVIHKLLMTEFSQPLMEVLKELKLGGEWSGEISHTCKNGDRVVVQSYWLGKFNAEGEIVELLESNVDLTERIRMQAKLEESAVVVEEYANQMEELANIRAEQLKEVERLAAIGATAGMVGHDIRNPLQSIIGDLFLAKTDLAAIPDGEEKNNMQESLSEIEKNVDYINKIVADLQDFARPLKPNLEEADLKLIFDQLLKKNGLPENIIFSVKVEIDARKVVVDSTFINRIMNNLVNNAVQAMPKGGKLTIHAYKEANDAVITVKDTGVGIPEAVKGKLFSPMFTTKAKGQGFGLAVVKRMSESLGGSVAFESQEGKGTTFIVRLPLKS